MTDWYMTRADQAIADIAAELAHKPMSRDALAESLLLSKSRTNVYVSQMHKERRIHVDSWCREASRGHWAQVFALGDLPDAPRPPARPKSEVDKARRKRNREAAKAEQAQRKQIQRSAAPVVADPMLAWIPRRAA
jgi:hypothetical protein